MLGIEIIRRWLRRAPPPRCQHPRATEKKWNASDGTPMVLWRCPDCGERDMGHVQGESWTEEECR